MNNTYDWASFYNALCELGPRLLIGINDTTRELIAEIASTSDMFWSDGLQDPLERDGDLRKNILLILQMWKENVLEALDSNFGIEMEWKRVKIDSDSALIDELIKAATMDE